MEELAQVYGRALFEVALEHDSVEAIRGQLGQFADAVDSHRELAIFLFSPYFSAQEKSDGLDRVLVGVDGHLLNFLRVLVDNHRMPVIFRIRREFERLWEAENRVLPVDVTSAIELDEATTRILGERIGEQTERKVKLTAHVNPEIIGGLIVRVGNSILDASIRSRLEHLRDQVAGASVS